MSVFSRTELSNLVEVLRADGVVVMPTDTVYGIVGSVNSHETVEKIFDIKKRINNLGTILFANKQQLSDFGFDENLLEKAMKYWPGPVSVVLPAPADKKYLAKDWDSLAVRIPEPEWLNTLLLKTGPLVTTSANLPDEPTVTDIDQAKKVFGDKVDFYLDGGTVSDAKPSKIVKIADDGIIETLR